MNPEKNKNWPYTIEEYDPAWAEKFESIKSMLEEVFADKAISIEHVGSTAIKGMKSKPLIDVLMTVTDIEALGNEIQRMEASGYTCLRNYISPNSLMFYKEGTGGEKVENIHVNLEGAPKAVQFIRMRDYFRMHPERVKMYSDLKDELSAKFPGDYLSYRRDKQEFLKETARLADEWAEKK